MKIIKKIKPNKAFIAKKILDDLNKLDAQYLVGYPKPINRPEYLSLRAVLKKKAQELGLVKESFSEASYKVGDRVKSPKIENPLPNDNDKKVIEAQLSNLGMGKLK